MITKTLIPFFLASCALFAVALEATARQPDQNAQVGAAFIASPSH